MPQKNIVLAVKTSLELIAFILLLLYMLRQFFNQMQMKFLGTLERRIVMENLTTEEICSIFAKQYLGETIRDWIIKVKTKLKELSDTSLKAIQESENELKNISKIDTKYEYEIEGRRKEACKNAHDPVKDYMVFTDKLLKHTEHLAEEKAFKYDFKTLEEIIISWKGQNKSIRANLDSMCNTCSVYFGTIKDCPRIENGKKRPK